MTAQPKVEIKPHDAGLYLDGLLVANVTFFDGQSDVIMFEPQIEMNTDELRAILGFLDDRA